MIMTPERLAQIKKEWRDWRFLYGTTHSDHQEADRMMLHLGRDGQRKIPELIAEIERLQRRVAELESLLYGLPPMSHGAGCQVSRGMNPCNCGLANWQVRRAALLEARNDA